jgi:hypothetical protein
VVTSTTKLNDVCLAPKPEDTGERGIFRTLAVVEHSSRIDNQVRALSWYSSKTSRQLNNQNAKDDVIGLLISFINLYHSAKVGLVAAAADNAIES